MKDLNVEITMAVTPKKLQQILRQKQIPTSSDDIII